MTKSVETIGEAVARVDVWVGIGVAPGLGVPSKVGEASRVGDDVGVFSGVVEGAAFVVPMDTVVSGVVVEEFAVPIGETTVVIVLVGASVGVATGAALKNIGERKEVAGPLASVLFMSDGTASRLEAESTSSVWGTDMAIAVVGISALNKITTINDARITIFTHGFDANIGPPEFVCNQEWAPDCFYKLI